MAKEKWEDDVSIGAIITIIIFLALFFIIVFGWVDYLHNFLDSIFQVLYFLTPLIFFSNKK